MADVIKSIEANSLTFAYLEAGTGPLVLLLHGFPDTAYSSLGGYRSGTSRETISHM